VVCLKTILDATSSKIVVDSAWRSNVTSVRRSNAHQNLNQMKAFFKIHHLDEYVIGMTPWLPKSERRADEIQEYLKQHPSIVNYVVIDDLDLKEAFPYNFVHVLYGWLNYHHVQEAIDILSEKSYQDVAEKMEIRLGLRRL